jgi:hypothetical protein
MMPRKVACVIESPDVSTQQLERMIAGVLIQCARDFEISWDIPCPTIKGYQSESDVSSDWDLIVFLPSSDMANALGYHSETPDGRKFARVFTSGMAIAEIEETFSHELLEMLLDPPCNRWAQSPNGELWPIEASDAVQGQSYKIDLGDDGAAITVADFVTPEFFDPNEKVGPFNCNQVHRIAGPFTLAPQGYTVLMTEGVITQRFGAYVTDLMRDMHRARKYHPAARTARRMAK